MRVGLNPRQSAARQALVVPKAPKPVRAQHLSPPHPGRIPNLYKGVPLHAAQPEGHNLQPIKTGPMPVLGYSNKQLGHLNQRPRKAMFSQPARPAGAQRQLRGIVRQNQREAAQYAAMVDPLSHENLAFAGNFAKNLLPQSVMDIAHGHAPSGKHLGEDALFFLPVSRAARAAGESIKAASLAQEGERAVEAGRAAKQSFKAGQGVAGGLAGASKKLLPSERALARSPGRRELVQHLFSVHEPKIAKAQLKLFDQSVKAMVRNGKARNVEEAAGRLIHVRSEIAPHELPQDLKHLYQHEAIPGPHGLPDTLDAKAIAKEIRATHGDQLPPKLRRAGALERAINRTYEHVKLGAGYRDWYKRYAGVMAKTAEHSTLGHVSPRQVAQLMAVYSQRARPTENFRRAITSALQHGDFGMFAGQAEKAKKIIQDPTWFEQHYLPSQDGPKISNYYANALQHLDPEHYRALWGDRAAPVTVDTHMNQMLLGADRVPNGHYDSLAQVFRVMGKHMGWSPEEVQAASWVSKKAANEAEITAKKMVAKGLKFAQRPASEYLHSSGDAYEHAYSKYAGTLFQRSEPVGLEHDTFNPHVAQVTSESNPDPHLWPEMRQAYDKLSPEDKTAYAAQTDEAISGKFEHALGLDHQGDRYGLGIWRGAGEPGMASHLLVGPGPISPEMRADMEALTAAQGIAKHQNSVSWGRPVPPAAGDFHGIHWTPPHGEDPVRASAALDQLAGEGNVGFIHAPDGGFYVINFSGEQGADFAIRRLGGEQTDIGWQGGYTIDHRLSADNPGVTTQQEAIAKLPEAKRNALLHAMSQVRAKTEQIDSHFLGTPTARIVSQAEAYQLAEDGTHVFHGTTPMRAQQIMDERTLRVGQADPEAAWTTTDPGQASWYANNGWDDHHVDDPSDSNIVAIPRERIPEGQGNAPHPFGAIGSPEDVLFQGGVSKLADDIARYGFDDASQARWLAEGPKNLQSDKAGDDLFRAIARKVAKATGRDEHTVEETLRTTDVLHQAAAQRSGTAIKGAFEHVEAAHGGIIHLTRQADVTTFPHELGHFLRRYGLNPEHEARIAEWAGVKNGVWDRTAEEKFARGLEKMIRQGDAPNNLKEEFARLEPLFKEVYPSAGHPLPTVPADVAQVYKQILGHRDGPQSLYYVLHNALVGRQLAAEARQGEKRTPEEAQAHVLEVSKRAEEQGFGRQLPKVLGHKEGEFAPETGGEPGSLIRKGLVGVGSQRNEQELERAVERSRRAGAIRNASEGGSGLERHIAAKTELEGKLPAGSFKGFEEAAPHQEELLNHIYEHPNFQPYERVRAADALLEGLHGKVPTKSDVKLLERAFGKQTEGLVASIKSGTFGEKIANVMNVPRSLMASGDLSAPFRQGLVVLASHPGTFFEGFGPMLKAAKGEANFQRYVDEIHAMPTYPLMEKSGLSLTDIGHTAKGVEKLSNREEQFMSNLAEQIPGIGRIVRGSDRAYVLFLNRTRARLFNILTQQAAEEGYHLNDKLTSDIAKFVNSATGRGDLGKLGDHTASLNALFFSPRLLASRVNFLNPAYYMKMEPFARRQALRAALRLAGTLSTVLMFAKAAGATVVTDPRNADFGKIRIGNNRLDIAGGFTQPIRLVSQLATGQIVSSTSGRLENLSTSGFGRSRLDVASQFLEGKMAPVPSTIVDLLRGSQFAGQPLTVQSEIANHMVPLLWQDIAQIQGSPGEKAVYGAADLFGVGVQSYGAPGPKTARDTSKLQKETQEAGLGKIPDAVQNDVKWKAQLDANTYAGQSSFDRAKAAVKLYDQRYGTHLETQILPALHTQGQAEALYTEIRSKLFPSLEHWQSAVNHVLHVKAEEKQIPQTAPKKSSAPATPTVTDAQAVSYHIPTHGVAGAQHTTGVPPELGSAIDRAAAKYGVPAKTLEGIWRIESGSTYPNPAVNSSGYGGLFGTTKWKASTQEQADYAAQTLRHLLDTHGGNMSAALSAYSGGGYTSVPGAGGGWHAGANGPGVGGNFAAVNGVPGSPGQGGGQSNLSRMADVVLESLASGNYNPIQVFRALSSQPLQNTMEMPGFGHVRFQIPKLQGPVGKAARGAIALAQAYLGTPYVWGGESPRGFDCSGLLQYIYAKQGVNIPRTSQEQWNAGQKVGKSQLRPGDAVFFVGSDGSRSAPGHVGIYIGHGKFIEAPHTGATVRISNLAGYPGYVGARRYASAGRKGRKV